MLKCIVVDDEQMNRKLIEEYISQVSFLEHVASCKNAFEAIEVLENQSVDLMFLDIQMPGMIGTDFLKILKKKPMTVFITAYLQYALEGYELEVIDYLMKPLSIERFTKTAFRALELHQNKVSEVESIFVNVDYGLVKVKLADVTYIEGLKDYIKIYTDGSSKAIITKMSLKSMEEKLPSHKFMRVHRSFIVNLVKIDKIKGIKLFIGEIEIPVSDNLLEVLIQKIQSS
jgi:DNA-binding LytR/AlgR family response regulator